MSASCFVVALLLTTAGDALAQAGVAQGSQPKVEATNANAAHASPSNLAGDAGALYEDASKYVERKFEEFRRARVPYNSALATKTYQEQRELAARHAAALAARGKLTGTDHYYLGLLYDLAGKTPEAIEPLRRFLDASSPEGTKEQRQNARLMLGAEVAALKRFDEAEQLLTDYARSDPATPQGLFKLHHALARAYSSNKKLEQSAAHARAAFRVAKESPVKAGDELSRAQVIASAGEFLADALVGLKKEREAAETMEELLRLGLTLPSAQVFALAERWLAENDQEKLIERVLGETPTPDAAPLATAPEIDIAEWIDQKPLKLADLRGRVVVLDFWATWCAPCRFTMPKLKTLDERFKREGLVVIGLTQFFGRAGKNVVTPTEELAYLRSYKKDLKLPYAFAVANDAANNMRYGVYSIPTAFIIDRRGRVRYIYVGASDADEDALAAVIEKLLAEQP
ncbi:MAG TPA: redoxin family protein [Pyrinomonadaceae bacterium]|nr:redoxin family protein [Pyrinomonadaceae bacterium]